MVRNLLSVLSEVGLEDAPLPIEHTAVIMLHGVETDPVSVMTEGLFLHNKVLAVVQGHIDLHGAPVYRPWAKLRSTAMPGDTVIATPATQDDRGKLRGAGGEYRRYRSGRCSDHILLPSQLATTGSLASFFACDPPPWLTRTDDT